MISFAGIGPVVQTIFGAFLVIVVQLATGNVKPPPAIDPNTWNAVVVGWAVFIAQWFSPLAVIFPMLSSAKSGVLIKDPPK